MQVDTLAVYWGRRSESAEACARRCSAYLGQLVGQYAQLGSWYEKGLSRKNASSGAAVNELPFEDLVEIVAKGTNKKDVGGQVMEELGFRVSLWNRLPDEKAIGLGIKCGLFAGNPGLKNSVVMQIPVELESLGLNSGRLKSLLVLTAEAWDADWGAVFNSNSDALLSRQGSLPFLDKMLWLRHGHALALAESNLIEEATEKGRLLVKM